MSSLFLTPTELHELTDYKYPSKQIIWLRQNGFTFRIAADGHPRVDRAHYDKMMGGGEAKTKTMPNFGGMLKVA